MRSDERRGDVEERPLLRHANVGSHQGESKPQTWRRNLKKLGIVKIGIAVTIATAAIVLLSVWLNRPGRATKIFTFSDDKFGEHCSHGQSDTSSPSNGTDSRVPSIAACLARLSQSTPSDEVRKLIRADKSKFGFQQTIDERALLYEGFRCFNFSMNLLVWGTGRDSQWFATVNKGKTRFLENLPDWIDFGNNQLRELNLDAEILKVDFNTNQYFADSLFQDMDSLLVALPDEIWDTRWDFIVVDSPWGGSNLFGPGRMSSIATTRFLHQCHRLESPHTAQVATVHDTNRHVEQSWGEAIFGRPLQCWQSMCLWNL